MTKCTPSALPEIDAVEIVDLRRIDAPRVDEYMAEASNASRSLIIGEEAHLIADLWRALRPGEQSRCHVPPLGFRFFFADHLVSEASICWQCNNIFGTANGSELHFEFDSSHTIAKQLLNAAVRLSGISTTG